MSQIARQPKTSEAERWRIYGYRDPMWRLREKALGWMSAQLAADGL